MTESSPVISFNRKGDYNAIASVGKPIPDVEHIAGDGEVLTRGPHVMKGYWKNPQASADALRDGWLHTGDLGRLDADGYLHITGRKKELLVLSNGKKVAPSQIEGMVLADPCIDQIVVCGEGRNFLSALVVPHWANLAQAMPCDPSSGPEALARDCKVHAFLAKRIPAGGCRLPTGEDQFFVIQCTPSSSGPYDELTVSPRSCVAR